MTEVIGGLLMMLGGGMVSGASIQLSRARRSPSDELVAALPYTPVPDDTPPEMLALLARLN